MHPFSLDSEDSGWRGVVPAGTEMPVIPTGADAVLSSAGVGAAVIDNHLYVVGGHSGSSYLNTVQRYEPISDSWLDSAGMMYCRCNFGLTAL